jgi:DNA-binding protein YbaB
MPPEVADALAKTDPEWKKKMGQSTEGMSPAPVTN